MLASWYDETAKDGARIMSPLIKSIHGTIQKDNPALYLLNLQEEAKNESHIENKLPDGTPVETVAKILIDFKELECLFKAVTDLVIIANAIQQIDNKVLSVAVKRLTHKTNKGEW